MFEWSDVELAVRDAVREFVDKEIRPYVDALESGEMEPYPIIRKLFAAFGIAEMARDSLNKRLARLREGGESSSKPEKAPSGGGMFGDGSQGGMGFVVVSELCRVSMGVVTGMGVSLGLTVPTIMRRGTLAQQERWLPDLVTYEKVGAWAITEPNSGSDAYGIDGRVPSLLRSRTRILGGQTRPLCSITKRLALLPELFNSFTMLLLEHS